MYGGILPPWVFLNIYRNKKKTRQTLKTPGEKRNTCLFEQASNTSSILNSAFGTAVNIATSMVGKDGSTEKSGPAMLEVPLASESDALMGLCTKGLITLAMNWRKSATLPFQRLLYTSSPSNLLTTTSLRHGESESQLARLRTGLSTGLPFVGSAGPASGDRFQNSSISMASRWP